MKLKRVYDSEYRKASSEFLRGCVSEMMSEAPGKAYRAMKKLGARPGHCDLETGFSLTSHRDQNLSAKESVERLADYFSAISQEYLPLDIDSLTEDVRKKIQAPVNYSDIPKIEAYQVWEIIKRGRKTKSSVSGELPAKLRLSQLLLSSTRSPPPGCGWTTGRRGQLSPSRRLLTPKMRRIQG